jgi:NAD+ kinase
VATAPEKQFNNSIKIDKVLILSKLSRYEFERRKSNSANDDELEKELRSRGTDFERLIHCHVLHKKFRNQCSQHFEENGDRCGGGEQVKERRREF